MNNSSYPLVDENKGMRINKKNECSHNTQKKIALTTTLLRIVWNEQMNND